MLITRISPLAQNEDVYMSVKQIYFAVTIDSAIYAVTTEEPVGNAIRAIGAQGEYTRWL